MAPRGCQIPRPRRDPAGMDIIKNETKMTVEEASKLLVPASRNLEGCP